MSAVTTHNQKSRCDIDCDIQMTVEDSVPWIQYQPPVKSHSMKEVVIERHQIPNVSLSILLGRGSSVKQGSSFNSFGEDFGNTLSVRIIVGFSLLGNSEYFI